MRCWSEKPRGDGVSLGTEGGQGGRGEIRREFGGKGVGRGR